MLLVVLVGTTRCGPLPKYQFDTINMIIFPVEQAVARPAEKQLFISFSCLFRWVSSTASYKPFFTVFSILFFFVFLFAGRGLPCKTVAHSPGHRFSHLRTYVRTYTDTGRPRLLVGEGPPDGAAEFRHHRCLVARQPHRIRKRRLPRGTYGRILQKKRVTTAVDVKSERPTIRT